MSNFKNINPKKLLENLFKYMVLCGKCSLPFGRVHRVKHSWVPQNKSKNQSQTETNVKEVSVERQKGPSAGTNETGLRERQRGFSPLSALLTTTDTPGVSAAA